MARDRARRVGLGPRHRQRRGRSDRRGRRPPFADGRHRGLATRTTSSGNSFGVGLGHGVHPSSSVPRRHRSDVTYPCSSPSVCRAECWRRAAYRGGGGWLTPRVTAGAFRPNRPGGGRCDRVIGGGAAWWPWRSPTRLLPRLVERRRPCLWRGTPAFADPTSRPRRRVHYCP